MSVMEGDFGFLICRTGLIIILFTGKGTLQEDWAKARQRSRLNNESQVLSDIQVEMLSKLVDIQSWGLEKRYRLELDICGHHHEVVIKASGMGQG